MNLSDCSFSVFDTETTDLNGFVAEAAVVHLDPGQPPRLVFNQRFNPLVPMSAGATQITGITDADLVGCPTWVEKGPDLMAALDPDHRVVVAYNAAFDWGRVNAENERAGLPSLPWPLVDPHVPLKALNLYGDNKLGTVCEARGIVLEGAHGAACDAMATAILWQILLTELKLGRVERDAYFHRQRQRALEHEASYVTWAMKKGFRERPDCPWHVIYGEPLPYWPEPAAKVGRCLTCGAPATYRIEPAGTVGLYALDGSAHFCR